MWISLNAHKILRHAIASALVVAALAPRVAQADVTIATRVRLIASDPRYCRKLPSGRLDCRLEPQDFPQFYRGPSEFRSRVEGNVTEQLLDLLEATYNGYKLQQALGALAASVVASEPGPAAVSAEAAYEAGKNGYEDFVNLLNHWGGRSVKAQDDFRVTYPNGVFEKVEIEFTATSDDDMLNDALLAPRVSLPGILMRRGDNTSKRRVWAFEIDLARFRPVGGTLDIPLGIAVSENADDCSASCLEIAKVLALRVTRPEDRPVEAVTSLAYWMARPTGCDVCGLARGQELMRNTLRTGELVQQARLRLRENRNGKYVVWTGSAWAEYDRLDISLQVNSPRPLGVRSPRIQMSAACVRGCPTGIVTRSEAHAGVDGADHHAIEGTGLATATISVADLPPGTYTIVLSANYESGGGGTIAAHTVMLTKVREAPLNRPRLAAPCTDGTGCARRPTGE
ncbi:MAG: hypothetical protein HY275_16710 [Gemmatimonadetes bacterium]|nr:hypothetical protein [Gemmatimonadota bacterium]